MRSICNIDYKIQHDEHGYMAMLQHSDVFNGSITPQNSTIIREIHFWNKGNLSSRFREKSYHPIQKMNTYPLMFGDDVTIQKRWLMLESAALEIDEAKIYFEDNRRNCQTSARHLCDVAGLGWRQNEMPRQIPGGQYNLIEEYTNYLLEQAKKPKTKAVGLVCGL